MPFIRICNKHKTGVAHNTLVPYQHNILTISLTIATKKFMWQNYVHNQHIAAC